MSAREQCDLCGDKFDAFHPLKGTSLSVCSPCVHKMRDPTWTFAGWYQDAGEP